MTNTHSHMLSHHDRGKPIVISSLTDRQKREAEKPKLLAQGPTTSKWQSWDLNSGSLCPYHLHCTTSQEHSRFLAWVSAHVLLPLPTELVQNEFSAGHM